MNIPGKYLLAGAVLFVAGLVAGGAIAAAASGDSNSDAEVAADVALVREVWKEYETTVNNEDLEQWSALWIQDGVQMPPDEPRYIGKEEIQAAAEPGFELFDFEDFSINPDEIQILGDQAYSHGTYSFTMTSNEGGDAVDIEGKFLTILQKQSDGSWKLAVDIFNYSPPE